MNLLFRKTLLSGISAKGLAVLIFLFCSGELSSQPWKFVKEEEGIKVYTAEEGNSSLKTFMGISDLHASVEKVSALLGDARGMSGWDKSVKEFRVLSEQKNKSFCYYLVYSTPWPLHDRDLCVEVNITREPSNGSVIILAKSNPKLVPENSSFVRIRNYWQKWIIEPLDIDHIRLTFEGYADPSGSVPSWLYNMVITETPIKMIREIRKRVE